MKKIVLSAMVIASLTAFATKTQAANFHQATIAVTDSTETPVKPEDLPEAVKKTLSSDAYAQWKVSAAFSVKNDQNEYYKIVLTKGEEKKTENFDKSGQVIK